MPRHFSAKMLTLALALSVGSAVGQGLPASVLTGGGSSGGGFKPTPNAAHGLVSGDANSRWSAEGWLIGPQRLGWAALQSEQELALGAGVSYALSPELRLQAGYLHALDRQGFKPRGLSLGLGLSF
jgi:opacity protein-like surface antigen